MLTHVDLFSGIGGFALAAGWAGFRTVAFCEIDKFCQEVLKTRFGAIADTDHSTPSRQRGDGREVYAEPESMGPECGHPLLIPDIFALDGTRFRGAALLTGGFPCQPFSCAGKRKGKEDDRHLWPQMLKVISEARPAWVLGENVAGIVNMELEQVCLDLEGEGYEVQSIIVPACAVNAPHRRDRVWIIGRFSDVERLQKQTIGHVDNESKQPDSDAPDAELHGGEDGSGQHEGRTPATGRQMRRGGRGNDSWNLPWIEVALRTCVRGVDDGVPRRVDRLKALGNAIVPQVAYQIIKAIAEIEMEKAIAAMIVQEAGGKE